MKKPAELRYTQLKNVCSPDMLPFRSTAELQPLEGIIGQNRAVNAFDFGLAVKLGGYNIYMAGPSGTGKTTYAKRSTRKLAAKEPVPNDWCYVYHFQNPRKPLAISFAPGTGRKFRDDMAQLVAQLNKELRKAFRSEDYEHQKMVLGNSFEKLQNDLVDQLETVAAEYGFTVKTVDGGLYFLPVVDGECVEGEAYEALPQEVRDAFDSNSLLLQEKAATILREMKTNEKENDLALEELTQTVGLSILEAPIQELKERYRAYDRAVAYLDAVQADLLKHLEQFMEQEETQDVSLSALVTGTVKKADEDTMLKYRVNLLVDHAESQGAPVITTFNPTYSNLMGEIEYDSEFGTLTTDFMKIKGGLFHQANGGYLIVQAQDILTTPNAWDALRRLIKTKQIDMDSLRELTNSTVVPSLKPEPIPASMKVILIGSDYNYALLSHYDEEFDKFFKIRADFDYEMPWTPENILQIAQFVKGFVNREHTLEFDAGAICEIIEYSSRSVSRQDKLSTRFNQLSEILGEANTWAKMENASIITSAHIRKTICEKEQRLMLYKEKMDEMLEENVVMIDTEGSEIGQINGLAVLDMGSYAFGTPTRITATTYVGKSGIVNIEKEARMSGQTHDKGVQIITGFLGQTYAQKFPMSLSCRVCFEQSYNGIDGDSASSTELYCILSSLAELPIRQDLAVTGSVNQKGELQAIGGVTHKIEGFFDLCKKRGLTGTQGVIIPASNIRELVLKEEIVNAVRDGQFHIYPITHINEGIELLMQTPAGEKDSEGNFPEDSVHGRVYAKLRDFAKASTE